MYIKNQIYFQYTHFNKSENFILENLLRKSLPGIWIPVWEKKKALEHSWIYFTKERRYSLMENPSMHRALEHTLAFSFHYFNTKLPDPAKALI